ncbi:MAG: branched-chain amino acid ABC transporter permease [Spirochaetales bacterium]|jgi:branched-chain amino acid transport system permease protein|nr:branched-chain amino acid ABC transporter permease [Spirochaetales bacterium]
MNILEQILGGLGIGSVYALLGLGFTMIFAGTRRINFAHGDIMIIGGFTGLVLLRLFPSVPVLAYTLAPLCVGLFSACVERVLLRPLQQAEPLKFVISTIGLSIVLKIIMKLIWGPEPLGYPALEPPLGMSVQLLIFAAAVALMIVLQLFMLSTRTGRCLRALSQDRYAARLMGVNVSFAISVTYFIAGTLAGIAGMMVGQLFFIGNSMGTVLGLKSFIAALIGGLGNIPGTIAGGLFLGVVENLSSGLISSAYKNAISLLFLVAVLLVRPEGLLSGFSLKHRKPGGQ